MKKKTRVEANGTENEEEYDKKSITSNSVKLNLLKNKIVCQKKKKKKNGNRKHGNDESGRGERVTAFILFWLSYTLYG